MSTQLARNALASTLVVLVGCVSGSIRGQHSDLPSMDSDEDSGAVEDASDSRDGAVTQPRDAGPPAAKPPVTFEPEGRGFSDSLMLKLTAGEAGAKLHYTLDGSVPSASSPEVTGPIAIGATTLVRVIAERNGTSSPVFNQSYFQLDSSVQNFSSNLPIAIVHMLGGAAPQPSSRSYVGGMFGVFETGGTRAKLTDAAKLTSRLGIKNRGRSTRSQDKPSYTLELWGTGEEDAPAALLGMPADGDWVLYAPYDWDRSMLHNVFAYDTSRRIGVYAPRTQFCEVFMVTGSAKVTMSHYAGIYVLTERLTRSRTRIPIKELEPTDIADPILSGGYIVKVDEPDQPNEAFTAAGLTFVYVDPDTDEIAPAQKQYIADYLNACKRAASAGDGKDPMTGKHYSELIDVPSFIDHHILSMLMKNPDAFSLSSYFYKDRGGKLVAGPLWDFDLAMGAIDPFGQRSEDPMYWGPNTSSAMFKRSFWGPLFTHAEFTSAYWTRWDELLASTFTSKKFRATIDGFTAQLTEAQVRNSARWPKSDPAGGYPAQLETLKTWLDARLTWINANKGVLPP